MGVLIMEVELIDQRLLDFFMQQEIAVDLNLAALVEEAARQMTVDIDPLAVGAVAREIGNVVRAVDSADAAGDRVERAVQHQARHVSIGQAQALMGADGMTATGRHGASQIWPSLKCPSLRSERRFGGGRRVSRRRQYQDFFSFLAACAPADVAS